jgi:hypothetical protein
MIGNWIGYWFFWFIKKAGGTPSADSLLQENGDFLLQENGDKILL